MSGPPRLPSRRSKKQAWTLVMKNVGFVIEAARRSYKNVFATFGYSNTIDWDDVKQEAYLATFRAAQLYNKNKSAFTTYMAIWIAQRVAREFRKQGFTGSVNGRTRIVKKARLISTNDIIADGAPRYLKDIEETFMADDVDYDDEIYRTERIELFKEHMKKTLTDREHLVVVELQKGKLLREVGEIIHLTRERVRQIDVKAKQKLFQEGVKNGGGNVWVT